MTYFKHLWHFLRALYVARNEPESLRPLAELYWRVLLSLAALCLLGILAYGVSEFVGVLNNLNSGPASSGHPPTVLDRKQLEATLSAFQARTAPTAVQQSGGASVTDPSK